jgi:hypothetical protein
MEKYILLTKSTEKGSKQEPERWNARYVATYRKWIPKSGEQDFNKTIVHIDHPSVPKGRMVVDDSVEDIDKQINEK